MQGLIFLYQMKCNILGLHISLSVCLVFFFLDKNILRFFFNLGVKVTLQTYLCFYVLYHKICLSLVVLRVQKFDCCSHTLQVQF